MLSKFISDFSGGAIDPRALWPAPNEALELVGADHRGPGLQPFKGPLVVAEEGSSLSNADNEEWQNIEEYVSERGKPYWIGKRGRNVWLGIPDAGWRLYRETSVADMCQWVVELDDPGSIIRDRMGFYSAIVDYETAPYLIWSGYVRSFRARSYLANLSPPYVKLGALAVGGDHSFGVWIKLEGNSTGVRYIMSSRGGPSGGAPARQGVEMALVDGKLRYTVCEDEAAVAPTKYVETITDAALSAGWHYVQAYYEDGSNPLLSVDGSAVAQTANPLGTPGILDYGVKDVYLGHRFGAASDRGWNGLMSGARMSSGILLDGDIVAQEAPRYADSKVALSVAWVPLLGRAVKQTTIYSESRNRPDSPEQLVQRGRYAYLAPDDPGPADYVQRWDGFFEDYFRATGDAIGTVVVQAALGCYPENLGIRSGDTIYFKVWDGTAMRWDINNGRVIKYVDTMAHTLVLFAPYDTTGLGDNGTTDRCDCVIVRTHRMGLTPGTTTTLADGGAGVGPAAGTYYATWRYINSKTGYSGTIAALSAAYTQAATNEIRASGWLAKPDALDIDGVEIYLSDDGANFYLVKTISRLETAELNFATSYDIVAADFVEDEDLLLEADAAFHTRPGPIRNLTNYGSRFHGVDLDLPNYGRYSILERPEYWPLPSLSAVPTAIQANIGGNLMIGANIAEPIVAIVNESNAYQQTGLPGGNLLYMLPDRSVRLFGFDATDYQPVHAFYDGTLNARSVVAAYGRVWFVNNQGHVLACSVGSSQPVQIHRRRKRDGIAITEELRRTLRVGAYDGWVIVPELGMCDADGLTWTDSGASWGRSFTVTRHPLSYPIIACGPNSLSVETVWALLEDATTPVTVTWKQALAPSDGHEIIAYKTAKFLRYCCVPYAAAGVPQTSPVLDVYLYKNHLTQIEHPDQVAISVPAGGEYERVIDKVVLTESAIDMTVKVVLLVPPLFHLDWLRLDYVVTQADGAA